MDQEIEALMTGSYRQALDLLERKRPELERLARGLLAHEVLYETDILRIIRGGRPDMDPPPRTGREWIA
ncbi:ATP-dependent zinc metalloprotease FtsH [compost metagenome]